MGVLRYWMIMPLDTCFKRYSRNSAVRAGVSDNVIRLHILLRFRKACRIKSSLAAFINRNFSYIPSGQLIEYRVCVY